MLQYSVVNSRRSRSPYRLFFGAVAFLVTVQAQPLDFRHSMVNLPALVSGHHGSLKRSFDIRFDLDGDGRKDILAIFQRRILVFFQASNGTFPSAPDVEIGAASPIPEQYAAVSVARLFGEKSMQLVFLGPTGADWISMDRLRAATGEPIEPQPLVRGTFSITSLPDLLLLDAALDLDGSGAAKVLLPKNDRLEIYGGNKERFTLRGRIPLDLRRAQQARLLPEPDVLGNIMFSDYVGTVRQLPRLNRWHGVLAGSRQWSGQFLVNDFNGDGRLDFLRNNQILLQNPDGGFVPTASDAFQKVAFSTAVREGTYATAPNLVDFNDDQILDTFRVSATAAKFSPRTDVEVFLGRADRSFADEPSFVLRTRDFAYTDVLPLGDLNRDGYLDMALLHLDFQPSSASSQVKAYMRKGLDGDIRFYLWDKQAGRLPEQHAFKHPVLVNYEIYGARQLYQQQMVVHQDFDGDGFPDLVIKTAPTAISIYRNKGGSNGFETRPTKVLDVPTRFSSFEAGDFNGDNRGDVLVRGYLDDQDDRVIYSFYTSAPGS